MSKINKKEHLEEVLELYSKYKSSEKVAEKIALKYNLKHSGSLSRKIRSWVSITKRIENKEIEESEVFKKAQGRKISESKFYLISSAQNATPVNNKLLKSVESYAKHLGAEILIIPARYKNPTSSFSELPNDWWDKNIKDYLVANRQNIHKKLTVLGDVKIQPTASTPLTGLEGLTGLESSIIGHPRQHLKTVPTVGENDPKFLFSTGSITKKNYTDSKAGKKGEFHHTFGFVIVEIKDNETFFIRQVSANKDGSFYDLDLKIDGNNITKSSSYISTVVLGDIHLGHHCPVSMGYSMDMLKRFQPSYTFIHDIMDGASISHHEKNDPFIALEREQNGSWDLQKELDGVVSFIKTILDYNPVIVKSNHDIFVDRWLLSNDWRKEKNKYAYLHYSKLKADGELPNGILPYNLKEAFGNRVKCLTEDESFRVNGIEFGIHGHAGVSGSKGSPNQFKKLNTKVITAHTHTPLKIDNLLTVGTNTLLRVGYNKGLSAWFNSNAITHINGKSQQLLIFGEKGYTTLN